MESLQLIRQALRCSKKKLSKEALIDRLNFLLSSEKIKYKPAMNTDLYGFTFIKMSKKKSNQSKSTLKKVKINYCKKIKYNINTAKSSHIIQCTSLIRPLTAITIG